MKYVNQPKPTFYPKTVEEVLANIKERLNNCPEAEQTYHHGDYNLAVLITREAYEILNKHFQPKDKKKTTTKRKKGRAKTTGNYDTRERLQEEIYIRYKRKNPTSVIARAVGVSNTTVDKIMAEIYECPKRSKELKELYG